MKAGRVHQSVQSGAHVRLTSSLCNGLAHICTASRKVTHKLNGTDRPPLPLFLSEGGGPAGEGKIEAALFVCLFDDGQSSKNHRPVIFYFSKTTLEMRPCAQEAAN
jgi:hypothetical protein